METNSQFNNTFDTEFPSQLDQFNAVKFSNVSCFVLKIKELKNLEPCVLSFIKLRTTGIFLPLSLEFRKFIKIESFSIRLIYKFA